MLQYNKTVTTRSSSGTFLLFLLLSVIGPLPNNFIVSSDNSFNLYPVLILKIILFLDSFGWIKTGDSSLDSIVGSCFFNNF